MAKIGRFLKKHFQDTKLEMYTGDDHSWISYADCDTMSYNIIIGTFKDYDEESGTIILISETGQEFYLSEDKIEYFWKANSGFNILKTTKSSIHSGQNQPRKSKNRDIM